MIVVKLMGGLGNQLFQYAHGRELATKKNTKLFLDVEFLLDRAPKENFVYRNFDLDLFDLLPYEIFEEPIKTKFHKSNLFTKSPYIFNENGFHYQSINKDIKNKKIYLNGYWQSFKYFENIQSDLRKELTFTFPLNNVQLDLLQKIKSTVSVCVNFRRTDFVSIPSAIQTHGVPDMEYYKNAIQFLKDRLNDKIELFIFSDDIDWCKRNFTSDLETHFIEHLPFKGERFSAYLQLMSSCKHFIIPNSTFGWWAAWISEFQNKTVITPKRWFLDESLENQTQDLRPENWITI